MSEIDPNDTAPMFTRGESGERGELGANEQAVIRLVDRVERGMDELGEYPTRADRYDGLCNVVPDLVAHCVLLEEAEGVRIKQAIFQVADIHGTAIEDERADQAQTDLWRKATFPHGFTVVALPDAQNNPDFFLVDLTFAQFRGESGKIGSVRAERETTYPNDHPLVNQLVEKGYARLTDAVLQDYLRLTTSHSSPDYIHNATVENTLLSTQPLPFDPTGYNELPGGLLPPAFRLSPTLEAKVTNYA